MAKAKKKLLPKDFDVLLKRGDLDALKAVFDSCAPDARGGYLKQTALAFHDCPDALASWLVAQGADVDASDSYGDTPLQTRARHWQGDIQHLLALGADVNAGENGRGTPLHLAAAAGNVTATRLLLAHGARPDALNGEGETPLAHALQRCSNVQIAAIAEVAALLLAATERPPPKERSLLGRLFGRAGKVPDDELAGLRASIVRIGTDFEFHRGSFNPDVLAEASAGLDRLYVLFDVPPVPPRAVHDGRAPIVATAAHWGDRFEELWAMLVPSRGAADTVQGEVIRIAGKIRGELDRNGGANWDADFRKMVDAFLVRIGAGVPIPEPALAEAVEEVAAVKKRAGDTEQLRRLAVEWVALNPQPVVLPPPDYSR